MLRQIKTPEELEPFCDLPASFCIPGCIFLQGVRRNAWHSTRVSYWYFGCSYFETEAKAIAAAERSRQRGSHLWYAEVPAVVLKNGRHCLAVIQPQSMNPFADYKDCDDVPATIGDFARTVANSVAKSEIWQIDPTPAPWVDSYKVYESEPQGSGLPLLWRAGRTHDLEEFNLLVDGLNESLRGESSPGEFHP